MKMCTTLIAFVGVRAVVPTLWYTGCAQERKERKKKRKEAPVTVDVPPIEQLEEGDMQTASLLLEEELSLVRQVRLVDVTAPLLAAESVLRAAYVAAAVPCAVRRNARNRLLVRSASA